MDRFNRLTRNGEWQVGARYRRSKGGNTSSGTAQPLQEVTFLGWQRGHAAKGVYIGWPVLLHADGTKELPAPSEWRNRWTPAARAPAATGGEDGPVETLVGRIDFPHLRDGGQWRQEDRRGAKFSLRRACHYADELRALGMSDPDIACLLSDLYWDAATEMDLKRATDLKPESEDGNR